MQSRPSLRGDGISNSPTLPLSELSRSRRGRGEARSKLSTLLQEEADPAPAGRLPRFLGRELRNAGTPQVLHTVGTWSNCEGHCSWAWMEPCPVPVTSLLSAAGDTLLRFLQVWNVSVYHQCQPGSENIQL